MESDGEKRRLFLIETSEQTRSERDKGCVTESHRTLISILVWQDGLVGWDVREDPRDRKHQKSRQPGKAQDEALL